MTFPKWLKSIFVSWVLIFAGIALTSDGITAPKRPAGSGVNHALIIGISKYANWDPLSSPVKDAETLAGILTRKYNFKKSNITLLTDKSQEKPTLLNILSQMERHANSLAPEDNLLIFFSGHSAEDDKGKTYWIPLDGRKKSKLSWVSHADVTEEIFNTEDLKVKNLCIVTDSFFSNKLIRPRSISLTPFDLRYTEKIREKAEARSREVIAFGDQHWPASSKTDGLGLFAYYIHKALEENPLDIIDFENLIFDETYLFPITKIAGTRLIRGRLRTKQDKNGQFIIAKMAPLPVVELAELSVSPQKGYPGDAFTVTSRTTAPAANVFIELNGKKIRMDGDGTQWSKSVVIDRLGTTSLKLAAINENDISGKPKQLKVDTIKRRAEVANIAKADVSPKSGTGGEAFNFNATTDNPARRVELIIGKKRYPMRGSGKSWKLKQPIEDIGDIEYSIVAINEDGVQGLSADGRLLVKAGPVNVLAVSSSPKKGFAGEEFLITASTDRSASVVVLRIDGVDFPMKGSGKSWNLKRQIQDIGKKSFKIIAKNAEGIEGGSRSGSILTEKSPLPVPEIASLDVKVVSPGKGYVGDRFTIAVNTTKPSDKVIVDIDGRQFPMEGSETSWAYTTRIDKVGDLPVSAVAKNADGVQGKTQKATLTALKIPARPVNILTASVDPQRGILTKEFSFSAKTDRSAKAVRLIVGDKRYDMKGSGTDWTLKSRLEDAGKIDFSIVALNEDNEVGTPGKSTLTALKTRYKKNADGTLTDQLTDKVQARFIDNGDGTITDLLSSLMWTRQPKQIAEKWDNAVKYCRELKIADNEGWRLPTISELNQLVDKKHQNPALPPGHPFSNILTHVGYWSKTRHKFGPRYVYQMSMWYGKAAHLKKSENGIVWPVRYAALSE